MIGSTVSWKVKGSLGGPEPDGFKLQQVCSVDDGGEHVMFEVWLAPFEARELWGRLGDELKAFDEAAGEPSN